MVRDRRFHGISSSVFGFALCFSLYLGLSGVVEPAHAGLKHVSEVSPGIFRGAMAEDEQDYETLREMGIRTVVSLQSMPFNTSWDRWNTEHRGMGFVHAPLLPWFFEPGDEGVDRAVRSLADPSLRPVYVHCFQGRDRTGLIVALHRVRNEGVDPMLAYQEWVAHGFEPTIFTRVFAQYYWTHVFNGEVPPPPPIPEEESLMATEEIGAASTQETPAPEREPAPAESSISLRF